MSGAGSAPQGDSEADRQEAIKLARIVHSEVLEILEKTRKSNSRFVFDEDAVISSEKLRDVVRYALRDLKRLEVDQKSEVSITKYVGYIAFWFAKLKPLTRVDMLADGVGTGSAEIMDINEKIVMPLTARLLAAIVFANPQLTPTIWSTCGIKQCGTTGADGPGICFFKKFERYLFGGTGKYQQYIWYCLRYRPSNPYTLVSLLDEALHFSCESACAPMFS